MVRKNLKMFGFLIKDLFDETTQAIILLAFFLTASRRKQGFAGEDAAARVFDSSGTIWKIHRK
jgi:hypothetical protein